MKKNRRIEKRMIAAILCVATLTSQMHIADAADLQISDSNTTQEQVSYGSGKMVLKIQECRQETQVQKQEKNKRNDYLGMRKKVIFPERHK